MPKSSSKNPGDLLIFRPLTKYGVRQRLMIYAADIALYWFINLIGKTVRFEDPEGWEGLDIPGWESYEEAYKHMRVGVHAFWHNRLFLMTYFWKHHESAVIVSESFDGEYIARTAQRFGYGVVRGSSTRGGSKALKQMVRLARDGNRFSLTIDGPKGPRHKVKSGAILLAAKAGVPIIPMLAEARRFWTVNSWDRLQIPKPFTRAKVFLGEPMFVSTEDAHLRFAEKMDELQQRLDGLVEAGKRWREGELST